MTAGEQGFLLLTAYLGDPERKPLTVAQFRKLTAMARVMEKPTQQRELQWSDLTAIGCDQGTALRVAQLLSQQEQLNWYLEKGRRCDCFPVTRISPDYPGRLRKALDMDAPGVLWVKGNKDILQFPTVSLVGSRELRDENYVFAAQVGKQAAIQGFALVSGNARGADRAAQDSCLSHGGKVISIVADALDKQPLRKNVLYMSEEGFDLPFTSQRAHQRNRIIHAMSDKTFVAQSAFGRGGTWSGTCYNLQHNLSTVACFDDGSEASRELENRGAVLISIEMLQKFDSIVPSIVPFIDR